LFYGKDRTQKQSIRNYANKRVLKYVIAGFIIVVLSVAGFSVLYRIPEGAYAQYSLSSPVQLNVVPLQLNVPFCDQDESVNNHYKLSGICWDTSAEMILNYWHNQGYLTSVPTQAEIYSDTMSYNKTGDLDAALASLGFYCAEFSPQQVLYTSYSDYQQQNDALSASQMIQAMQLALSLGVPLEATVETQPYPQATASTGGILCDSRGTDHAIVITGYNQTGFIFNSATNEEFNPSFVSNDSLNTYAYDGRVVNGYELYCSYSEFMGAYNHEIWGFMAVFPLNYAPIMCQQSVQIMYKNGNPISGILVSSPFSSAITDSKGYARLNITELGAPISVGYNMQACSNRTYSGQYTENPYLELGFSFGENYGMYMLYPSTNATGLTTWNYPQIEFIFANRFAKGIIS